MIGGRASCAAPAWARDTLGSTANVQHSSSNSSLSMGVIIIIIIIMIMIVITTTTTTTPLPPLQSIVQGAPARAQPCPSAAWAA
jgi:hypothetical protein